MQPVAAGDTRGIAAGRLRMVGMPLGECGDAGAPQVGREVSRDRPRGRDEGALAAAQACAVGSAAPAEQRPQHPEVAAQRRAAWQRWRELQRVRKAAKLAAARDDAAGGDIAA
jgi:hypothetical protein